MKKGLRYFIVLLLSFSVLQLDAQRKEREEEKPAGWNWNNAFLGSGFNLGFSNGFIIGLNPEFGYSISEVIDAGVAINLNYITQRYRYANSTVRYLALGGGPFLRIWPVSQFFVGGQFEYNRISLSEKTNGSVISRATAEAPSLLVGIGYGTRRIGQGQFYTSIMIDAMNDLNSPYRDEFGRILPVFRTGFSFYFGRKGKKD